MSDMTKVAMGGMHGRKGGRSKIVLSFSLNYVFGKNLNLTGIEWSNFDLSGLMGN